MKLLSRLLVFHVFLFFRKTYVLICFADIFISEMFHIVHCQACQKLANMAEWLPFFFEVPRNVFLKTSTCSLV